MAILDKQGLQHYANKMCNADNRKVGSKSLPTALNDIDTAINGFKNAFEIEYGSPVNMEIVNNQNIFTVGTGNNVDKKDDVENSFTDLKISGNSLVNLNTNKRNDLFGTSGDGSGYSKNFNEDSTICTYKTVTKPVTSYVTIRMNVKEKLKKNTQYTLIFNILENSIPNLQKGISVRGASDPYHHPTGNPSYYHLFYDVNFNNTPGKKVIVFTTGNNTNEYTGFGFGFPSINNSQANLTFKIGNIMLLEGDWTDKCPPEYFEGLKSVGEKQDDNHKLNISSIGKNLCPYNNAEFQAISTTPWIDMLGKDGIYGGSNVSNTTKTWFYLSPAKYTVSFEKENCHMQIIDKNENIINFNKKFDGGYVCIRLKSTITSGKYCIKKLQIELSETQTSYEAYKIDTKEILLNEPLRGLPNGIKDTIEKINGEWKIVRRCGEVIFNGSQPVTGTSNLTSNSTWSKFGYQLEDCKDYSNVVCDSLAYQTDKSGINPDLGECVGCTNNMWKILFQVKKNNNVPSTVAEVNDYMKKNPKKVIYELINPIIEDIDPVTLQCWKNGTISIIDEVIPVETTHTVSLNKSAQIQKNIEELTSLKNRVKTLEEQYSKTALNQAYETELLKLDMKLDNII